MDGETETTENYVYQCFFGSDRLVGLLRCCGGDSLCVCVFIKATSSSSSVHFKTTTPLPAHPILAQEDKSSACCQTFRWDLNLWKQRC